VGPGGLGGPEGGLPAEPYLSRLPAGGVERQEFLKQLHEEAEAELQKEKDKNVGPMSAKDWRKKQEQGFRPELFEKDDPIQVNAPAKDDKPSLSYEDIMSQHVRPHLQEQETKPLQEVSEVPPRIGRDVVPVSESSDPHTSEMPAAKDGDGKVVKTIEHYTFADSEDKACFYVSFDKDLWEGAAKHIREAQVKVESKATSLEIRIENVPVSNKSLESTAEWRLSLSPLFSRIEPMMTSFKVRNGKLSVKLAKSKALAWKKGVKY